MHHGTFYSLTLCFSTYFLKLKAVLYILVPIRSAKYNKRNGARSINAKTHPFLLKKKKKLNDMYLFKITYIHTYIREAYHTYIREEDRQKHTEINICMYLWTSGVINACIMGRLTLQHFVFQLQLLDAESSSIYSCSISFRSIWFRKV